MDELIEFQAKRSLGLKLRFMREHPRRADLQGKRINGLDVAQQIGQGQGSIGNYETGKRVPPLQTLNLICEFLGYPILEALPERQDQRDFLYKHWGIDGLEGLLNSPVDTYSVPGVNLTSSERRVKVQYSVNLTPGEFAPSQPISKFNKTVSVTLEEYGPEAIAIIYSGSSMGEMLEHQQPIIIDKVPPNSGDLCMLRKNEGFMYCVFHGESPFGQVFRLKGTSTKRTIAPGEGVTVYKVIALKNASDIE
jgi:transcriptional regulator with XRE-family HTH domain